jgi:hypothetical protein
MLTRFIVASALALFSVGPAAAGTTSRQQTFSTTTANSAAVKACEAQMQRMAGLNKTLAANYNAEHAYDDCAGQSGGASTDEH